MRRLGLVAERLHDVDHLGAGRRVVGLLRVEPLAVSGDAAGHRRDALDHGGHLEQVGQGAAQLVAVVHPAAEHQLAVDRDARLHQPAQIAEGLAPAAVGQHFAAQLGVGGVDRDVDGRDVHPDDAVDLVVVHIGQGDIVAEEEGQPLVVVLEIQAPAHAGGQLVDEAEDAPVGAGMLFIPEIGGKAAPELLPRAARHLPAALGAAHPGGEVEAWAVGVELIVQRVVDGVAVHAQQFIPGAKAQPLRL